MTESAHSSQYILNPLNNNPVTVAGGRMADIFYLPN